MTSNESGRAKMALDIIKCINQKNEAFGRETIVDANKREKVLFEKSEPYLTIKELEIKLRACIENNLSKIDKNWWKGRVSLDVQEKAQVNLGKSTSPWPWVKPEEKAPLS